MFISYSFRNFFKSIIGDNRKSLYFKHGIEADKMQKLKTKT